MVLWVSEAFNSMSFCCSTDSRSDIFLWTSEISCSTWRQKHSMDQTFLAVSIISGSLGAPHIWADVHFYSLGLLPSYCKINEWILNLRTTYNRIAFSAIPPKIHFKCVCACMWVAVQVYKTALVSWQMSLVAIDDTIRCAITALQGLKSTGNKENRRAGSTVTNTHSHST